MGLEIAKFRSGSIADRSIADRSIAEGAVAQSGTSSRTAISTKMLCNLAHSVKNGNPIWTILRANEYFPAAHPFRQVLVAKARAKFEGESLGHSAVCEKIYGGAVLSELDEGEQSAVQAIAKSVTGKKKVSLDFTAICHPFAMDRRLQRRLELRGQQKSPAGHDLLQRNRFYAESASRVNLKKAISKNFASVVGF